MHDCCKRDVYKGRIRRCEGCGVYPAATATCWCCTSEALLGSARRCHATERRRASRPNEQRQPSQLLLLPRVDVPGCALHSREILSNHSRVLSP